MKRHYIIRVISKLLIPCIFLFALYVQFHGDYGPGGGFQAGVIFASGIVLYTLVVGLDRAQQAFHPRIIEILVAIGVLIYGSVGIWCLASGGKFLDYNALADDPVRHPQHGQHLGILLVELGVGITVAAVVVSIFFAFVNRGRS